MGYLLDTMTPKTVDAQRDVVKNERRQSVENQPYGMAEVVLGELLYPGGPPVSLAGDRLHGGSHRRELRGRRRVLQDSTTRRRTRASSSPATSARPTRGRCVEKWFGDVKAGPAPPPMTIPGAALTGVQKKTITDRVQLPRLYLAWLTPRHFEPGDAALDIVADVLAGGKNSRLYKRLVYDMQIAQDVSAFQASAQLASAFQIVATPRPGHTVAELQKVIDEEIAEAAARGRRARTSSSARSTRSKRRSTTAWRSVGGFGGKGDQLNAYYTVHGRSRLVQRGSRALPRALGRATSAPPPRSSCRSTRASS